MEKLNLNELHQEARKMSRHYEQFKRAEEVLEALKEKQNLSAQLDRDLLNKQKKIEAWNEEMDQAAKNHESNIEKRRIELESVSQQAKKVMDDANAYREHERQKGAEYIHNANEYVKSLEEKIEVLKNSVEYWKEQERVVQHQHEKAKKELDNLRDLLK